MVVYKCNSCGAIMDTDAAARAMGYGPDTKVSVMSSPPSKCGVCGSTNISLVSNSSNSSKSGCFIATATYGTPFAEEINILRYWRDNFLLKHLFGRLFIKMYYTISPPIADFISKRDRMKGIVRAMLNPYVNFLKYLYKK